MKVSVIHQRWNRNTLGDVGSVPTSKGLTTVRSGVIVFNAEQESNYERSK